MTGFSAVHIAEDDSNRRWAGVPRVAGPVWTQLPTLTVGLFGVQMLWSVEMSYASPYLLSLGLSKSLMAVVFLAGPLSGLIVQPMIGILADNSKSRFGRRRPFIVACAALCAFSTLLLGFTRPFATIFTTLDSNDILTVWLAILSIYCIDFCINAVQALDRALLVDILPATKQPAGNAWAARMLAVGSVAGFFVGNLDLPRFFPFLGSAQLGVLSLIAALLLFSTQAWVCFHVKERVLLRSSSDPKGFRQELKVLSETLVRLPSVIRQICWIQFFAWLGWFPVLFYTTVYIGELHKQSSPIPENEDAVIALDAESTRLGSRAMFYSALVSLAANIIMPSFVVPQHAGHASRPLQPKQKTWLERVRMHLTSLWALSHFIFAMCMAATFVTSTVSGATFIVSVTGFCWAITQWAPFALLGEAILSHPASDDTGSIHLADTRSTRAVRPRDDVEHNANEEETQLLFQAHVEDDEEEEEEEEGVPNGHPHPHLHAHARAGIQSSPGSKTTSSDQEDEADPHPRIIIGLGNARARVSRIDIAIPRSPPSVAHLEGNAMTSTSGSATTTSANGLNAQAGAIIGIHNVFIVIPQFLVTGLSSIIFAIFDPDISALHGHHVGNTQPSDGTSAPPSQDAVRQLLTRSDDNRFNSIAIIFRLGGIAAAIAFILSYRLAKELKRH
ncbi:major facilitator superfamily domain-containing protein [Butyriboletus roseoflavus]|nr:major facilitator superfamily domain-containing protein [Butyriboletus roseoflavus]